METPTDVNFSGSKITANGDCSHEINRRLLNSAVATGLEKVSFHSKPKERKCKECSDYHTIALISHTSKVMLKILQARLQQYVNRELPDVQAGISLNRGKKAEEPEIKLPTSAGSLKKAREFQKNIYFCFY